MAVDTSKQWKYAVAAWHKPAMLSDAESAFEAVAECLAVMGLADDLTVAERWDIRFEGSANKETLWSMAGTYTARLMRDGRPARPARMVSFAVMGLQTWGDS